jgi:hypothetical protein
MKQQNDPGFLISIKTKMTIEFILVYRVFYLTTIHHAGSCRSRGPGLQPLLTNLADP